MIGILIQLIISWLLLWLFEKKDLTALGIKPTKGRLFNFLFGFLTAAICFTIYCLTTTTLTNNHWTLNNDFTAKNFATSSWWTLNSVLFEELIFRGALLYILIQKIGINKACLISSIAFGIYHWFSYGVLGNPIQMIYVFFSTGIWGLMYALAFAKTKSLYLPIGLHLGWNLFNIVVFSQGPLGQQLLINDNNGKLLNGLPSLVLSLFQLFFLPTIVYLYLRRYERAEGKSEVT
ncbi:MAG: CPBP family intramembrane metalloprotease [Bacteroidetes bacterium]|nr:CPBP family intramembrane metalloprotease [Bacteroidota bacterium]